jgi:hypothetical protein
VKTGEHLFEGFARMAVQDNAMNGSEWAAGPM